MSTLGWGITGTLSLFSCLGQVCCRCGAVQLPGSLKASAHAVPRCMENEASMDILLAAAQASPVSRFLRKCGLSAVLQGKVNNYHPTGLKSVVSC